jgi:hypothetical protein
MVLTLVITPLWTQRSWALPVLSVPTPTPEVSRRLGLRHKTVPHRWLPGKARNHRPRYPYPTPVA